MSAIKSMDADYGGYAVKHLLYELGQQPLEALIADLDELRAWAAKHVTDAGWKAQVFADALTRLEQAARLEKEALVTQPEEFAALSSHWFAVYEHTFALTGTRRHD